MGRIEKRRRRRRQCSATCNHGVFPVHHHQFRTFTHTPPNSRTYSFLYFIVLPESEAEGLLQYRRWHYVFRFSFFFFLIRLFVYYCLGLGYFFINNLVLEYCLNLAGAQVKQSFPTFFTCPYPRYVECTYIGCCRAPII